MSKNRWKLDVEEAYVPFPIAKLLKGKGFACVTRYKYRYDGTPCDPQAEMYYPERDYRMPTQQMAMAWIRRHYGFHILIDIDDLDWNFTILDFANRDENGDPVVISESYGGFKTYEDAANAGIKHCLENYCEYCNEIENRK